MSNDRREPGPEEWPTYPGGPGPSQPSPQPYPQPAANDQPGQPYADYDPEQDEAYRAYQDYARAHPDPSHEQLQSYQNPYLSPPADPNARSGPVKPDTWMQNKWTWIIGGIVGAIVITGLFRGDTLWPLIIFAIVIWQVLRHRRKN